MKQMSEYVTMLENMPELEVSIIRATKINKVLKAILKLESIPREAEFSFKGRSQTLLDKWNKLMAADGTPVPTSAPTNGVNGTSESHAEEKKSETSEVKSEKKGSEGKESAKASEEPKEKEAPAEPEKPAEAETKAEEPAKEVCVTGPV